MEERFNCGTNREINWIQIFEYQTKVMEFIKYNNENIFIIEPFVIMFASHYDYDYVLTRDPG